jgi:hypothetical protein
VLLATALGAIALACGAWLALHRVPTWYRPPELDEAGQRRARASASALYDWVSARMAEGRPFDVLLDESDVNDWFVAAPRSWPRLADALPPEIGTPQVRFSGAGLLLAARYSRDEFECVVTARMGVPRVSPDEGELLFEVHSLACGALKVPQWLARRVPMGADEAMARTIRARSPERGGTAVRSMADVMDELGVRNRFRWSNGDRWFRVAEIAANRGTLRLRIEPFPARPQP